MAKLRLLADVPYGEGVGKAKDGLRFKQYATILARAALDTPESFTIGVYGGWGSGKTSLMRMILETIEADDKAIGVWFNAWRYEKEEHLIVPLLATIITEMKGRESKLTAGAKEAAKSMRDALRGVLYGVSVKGKLGIPGVAEAELSISPDKMVDRYEKLSEMATERILDQSLYFRSFTELDKIARKTGDVKLVVFVDDLDRCFPDKAIALLENVKLVLNQPNMTFVLGIAPKMIQAYLKSKYKKEYDIGSDLYEDYLEKLVQLPFQVPDIKDNVQEYVRGLLRREEVFGKISAKKFNAEYEPLVSICGPACKDNPRAIVRFLNRLLLLKRVHEEKVRSGTGDLKLTISLVHFGITNALQLKWPEVFRACETNRTISVAKEEMGLEPSLCEMLANVLEGDEQDVAEIMSKCEAWAKVEDNPEREVFGILARDGSLRTLLGSEPGREWLLQPELRREAVATMEEVKAEAKEEGGWRHYIVPWAEGYQDGWPVCRVYVIRPGADLRMANLGEADLGGANLTKANLTEANLVRAYLRGARLVKASLGGANLRGAKLTGAVLQGATYDKQTLWPEGFDPDGAGAILIVGMEEK